MKDKMFILDGKKFDSLDEVLEHITGEIDKMPRKHKHWLRREHEEAISTLGKTLADLDKIAHDVIKSIGIADMLRDASHVDDDNGEFRGELYTYLADQHTTFAIGAAHAKLGLKVMERLYPDLKGKYNHDMVESEIAAAHQKHSKETKDVG